MNDEAASDPPSEDDNDWEKILEQETDQMLAELTGENQEQQEEQEQPEQEDVEVSASHLVRWLVERGWYPWVPDFAGV